MRRLSDRLEWRKASQWWTAFIRKTRLPWRRSRDSDWERWVDMWHTVSYLQALIFLMQALMLILFLFMIAWCCFILWVYASEVKSGHSVKHEGAFGCHCYTNQQFVNSGGFITCKGTRCLWDYKLYCTVKKLCYDFALVCVTGSEGV